ncbi:hypothetical protein RQP46_007203 [Phenoliferia psychrophenolica]
MNRDVSKQIIGQAFVHASNVAISDLIARHKSDNPCSLYALNIAVDTTLGVGILYLFLKALTSLLSRLQPDSFRTGDYGDPFSMRVWAKQACVYVAALGLMKLVVVLLFWAVPSLFVLANWCLSWLTSDDAQVVFVMLIFPLVMNLIQFLTIDSILKSKTLLSSPLLDDDLEARRGLFESPSDEDEDDDDDRHHHASSDSSLKRSSSKPFLSTPSSLSPDDKKSASSSPTPSLNNSQIHSVPSGSSTPTNHGLSLSLSSSSTTATPHSYPPLHPPSSSSSSSPTKPPLLPKRLSYGTAAASPPPAPKALSSTEDSGERSSFEDAWGLSDEEDEGSLSGEKVEEDGTIPIKSGGVAGPGVERAEVLA